MKKYLVLIAFAIMSLCSCERTAVDAIEDYLESQGYECEVVSASREGDRYRIYFDKECKRLSQREKDAWTEFVLADEAHSQQAEKIWQAARDEYDEYMEDLEYDEYDFYACIIKCSDYQMKKDLESMYYFVDPDCKKVWHTESKYWR